MRRLAVLAFLACGLLLVALTPAGLAGGYYGCGYSYSYPSYGYSYPSYSYYPSPTYYYPYYYSYQASSYPYQAPAAQAPTYGPGWKSRVVEYARDQAEYATFLKALDALGVPRVNYGVSAYGGAPYPSGNTQYGYSYKQLADFYGATDVNATFQQASRLAQGVQEAATSATQQFGERQKEAIAGQARVAEILAEGEAVKKKLDAARPEAALHVETQAGGGAGASVTPPPAGGASGTAVAPSPGAGATPPDAGGVSEAAFLALRQQRCGACHGPKEAKAKLDMTRPWNQYDAELRAQILDRLTTTNGKRHMPQTTAGQPAQLPADEICAFAQKCLEGGQRR